MIESIIDNYGSNLKWIGIASTFFFLASLLFIPLLVCRLDADYFQHLHKNRKPGITMLFLRYLLGGILLLAGILMLFLPGQGLLTIILGLSLLDFPGKHKAVQSLLARPTIQKGLNWMRAKGGKNNFNFTSHE